MAEKGEDTAFKADFAKTKNNKVDKPPYYAVMVKPNLTYSLAGALITPKAEVGPIIQNEELGPSVNATVESCRELSKTDWDSFETSWDFKRHPLL